MIEWAHQCGYSRLWKQYRLDRLEHQWIQIGIATYAKAARYGHLDALRLLRQHVCDWGSRICQAAAEGGHLAILQWARENSCDWDWMTCSAAAKGGHLSVLQWAKEDGCPWDEMTSSAAAQGGHLSCLQWAITNGCDWDKTALLGEAGNCGNPNVYNYVCDQLFHW